MQFNWKELSKYDEPAQMAVSQVWDEYKYRHTHIWRITMQITTAVVALSVVPYLDGSENAGLLRFTPLLLATALAFFMYLRVIREFELFNTVKTAYMKISRTAVREEDGQEFLRHTKTYLLVLAWGSFSHIILIGAALLSDRFYSLVGFGFHS